MELEQLGLDRLRELRRHMHELVEAPAWASFKALAEATQAGLLQTIVMNPLDSMDGALRQEYDKGRYKAIDDMLNLPESQLDVLGAYISRLEAEEARRKPADDRNEFSAGQRPVSP